LRLNRGVDLRAIGEEFGSNTLEASRANIKDLIEQGLLQRSGDRIFLTARGRLLSNEVFQSFLQPVETRPGL
jgi:oxygen-independent coproporphyrinogen-3 oxidase